MRCPKGKTHISHISGYITHKLIGTDNSDPPNPNGLWKLGMIAELRKFTTIT